jgi:hypothetical protein
MITHPLVGVAGFEPATSSSQTRRDDRATLHPELLSSFTPVSFGYFQNCAKHFVSDTPCLASAKIR